ncbi:glycerate kinase [Polynucleobacter sp. MWH-UH23A]|uniref:glycerate kinase type-2 family protein n=1 Tax=Polynucleobacter sp. MWH-UH23A TaxID=1855613 RepID=UPI003364ED0D
MTQQHSQPIRTETILKNAFAAAVAVADPQVIVPQYLAKIFPAGQEPKGRCLVVGAGKASASMASALETYAKEHWPQVKMEGVVLTRYGHSSPTSDIQIIQAGHPVPDQAGMNGAKAILELTQALKEGDVLIALVSGGGSSLLTLPVEGISIDDMRKTTEALLRSGAPIEEMNIVRKHLSAILGGNLARCAIARGARVEALLISDVTGDSPADIASGPCAADYSTYLDALNIIESYRLQELIPESVMNHLKQGLAGQKPETLKDADLVSARVSNHVIATAYKSLEAAANFVYAHGYESIVLGDTITGEAQEVGAMQAQLAREYLAKMDKADKPLALISGGECTVTIPAETKGRGGRCSEYLLSLFANSADLPKMAALAADTDGIDGSEKNAGAWFDGGIRESAKAMNLEPKEYLVAHDCYGFFAQLGALVETGPTLTNVNDFRIILLNK